MGFNSGFKGLIQDMYTKQEGKVEFE